MNIIKAGLFCLMLSVLTSCGNTGGKNADGAQDSVSTASAEEDEKGKITFKDTAIDFGQITEGKIVDQSFEFENTGAAPVILAQVSTSCGCTTSSYTKTVLPGKSGEVKVSFDSNGQVGKQQKIITVISNAENSITTIQLKGEVLPK